MKRSYCYYHRTTPTIERRIYMLNEHILQVKFGQNYSTYSTKLDLMGKRWMYQLTSEG